MGSYWRDIVYIINAKCVLLWQIENTIKVDVCDWQIESTLDMISTFVVEMKTSLEHVITQSSTAERGGQERPDRHKKANVTDVLGKTLKNVHSLITYKHYSSAPAFLCMRVISLVEEKIHKKRSYILSKWAFMHWLFIGSAYERAHQTEEFPWKNHPEFSQPDAEKVSSKFTDQYQTLHWRL